MKKQNSSARLLQYSITPLLLCLLLSSLFAADNIIGLSIYENGTRANAQLKTTETGGVHVPHVIVDSGGGPGGGGDASAANQATQITAEQAIQATAGAKADAKSTATDTTPISLVSILKQISASVQAPPAQAVTGPLTDAQLRATAVPVAAAAGTNLIGKVGIDQTTPGTTNAVAITGAQYTISITSVTADGTVAAGKHHIEFILSTDFAGSIGGVTMNAATLAVYNPGDAPVGSTFAALSYTITAGNAVLTTW